MVKFLHTADWHLGIKYKQLGDKANEARDIRLKSVQRLLDCAKNNNVDFVLVAGDLFDGNHVNRNLVDAVSKMFMELSPIPVYVLPGNHDPLTRDSLFNETVWESLNNVTIFRSPEPLDIENVTLFPCPITQKQSKEDPTQWINTEDDNQINIGVAHGNLQVGFIEDANFPINPERSKLSGLDYLALGEWHSLFEHKDSDGVTRTLYPGTPETTKFGEVNSGQAVIVEINAPDEIPQITPVETGSLSWQKMVKEVNTLSDANNIQIELREIRNPENNIISFILKGVTDQETINYLYDLEDSFQDKFMLFQLIMDELYLKPNLLELKSPPT